MTDFLALAVGPAVFCWALIAALRGSRLAARLRDSPNERSLHAAPSPRIGGIAVSASGLVAAASVAEGALLAILACAAALAVLSFLDDLHGLPIEVRLPGHFVASGVAVLALGAPAAGFGAPGAWCAAGAVLGLAWSANLFNFMDGADGLAGEMAAHGFGTLALGAWWGGDVPLALAATAIASASLGFVAHNFPPARVFLGDCGSIALGFLAGAMGGYGAIQGRWPAWFPLLVFSPFVIDATLTLAARILRREPFWRAHRQHYYQRLVLSGWSHRRLALAGAALMLATSASALVALRAEAAIRCAILVAWTVAFVVLAAFLERRLPAGSAASPRR